MEQNIRNAREAYEAGKLNEALSLYEEIAAEGENGEANFFCELISFTLDIKKGFHEAENDKISKMLLRIEKDFFLIECSELTDEEKLDALVYICRQYCAQMKYLYNRYVHELVLEKRILKPADVEISWLKLTTRAAVYGCYEMGDAIYKLFSRIPKATGLAVVMWEKGVKWQATSRFWTEMKDKKEFDENVAKIKRFKKNYIAPQYGGFKRTLLAALGVIGKGTFD